MNSALLEEKLPAARIDLRLIVAGVLLALVTAASTLFGNVAVPAAPVLLIGLLWVVWKVPARLTVFALIFLGLILECRNEQPAVGLWKSPLFFLGDILLAKANDWTGIRPLIFTGVDLVVLYVSFLLVWRRATGSRIDVAAQVQTARIMALAVSITLVGTLWIWVYGLARGGNFGNALLQVWKLVYVPVMFFFCQAALRGPADHPALARVMIGAAMYRSLMAAWVHFAIWMPAGVDPRFGTTHGDSMLFASAAALIVAMFNERVGAKIRGSGPALMACLAVIVLGMYANNRRIVWIELAAILLTFYLMSPWTPLKRTVARTLIIALPLISFYLIAGWNRPTGAFAPVGLVRSIADSKSDPSTMWRDLENMNLIVNILDHPVLGTGFGHEYRENYKLPDISASFMLYKLVPHNSLLGFLAFAGLFGFTLMWCAVAIGILLAARSYRFTSRPLDRAMALWVIGVLIAYMNSIYGDMGQGSWTAVFTVCPALAVAGKLAVATGAWPARRAAPVSAIP